MTVGVVPVDTSAAIVVIDLAWCVARWIGPMLDALGRDTSVGGVELVLADEKCQVLWREGVAAPVRVVERDAVTHVHDEKLSGEVTRRIESQDVDEVIGSRPLVRAPHDEVIEVGHGLSLRPRWGPLIRGAWLRSIGTPPERPTSMTCAIGNRSRRVEDSMGLQPACVIGDGERERFGLRLVERRKEGEDAENPELVRRRPSRDVEAKTDT